MKKGLGLRGHERNSIEKKVIFCFSKDAALENLALEEIVSVAQH